MSEDNDPKERLESKCRKSSTCVEAATKLQFCANQVEQHIYAEDCSEEFFALSKCIDKCVRNSFT